jgi:hypothetical protein
MAEVTPQKAARMGERPIPRKTTMMIRGMRRWRRGRTGSLSRSSRLVGSSPILQARKWMAARSAT